MKNPMRIGASIVCLMIVFMVIASVIVALNKPADSLRELTTQPSTAILYTPEELYQQAVNSIAFSRDLTLSIYTETQTRIGEEVFSEKSEQTVHYNDLGTGSMTARVDEKRILGEYTVPYFEAYADDLMYCSIGGGNFCSHMSASAFQKRFAPAVLLDPTFYKSSSVTFEDGIYLLKFEQATAIENWISSDNVTLIDATGTAVLDENSNLLENTYSLTYNKGIAEVSKSVHVLIQKGESFPLPQTIEYLPIQNPDAPLMLERACGYLMQATSVSAQTKESILCEAFGDNRTQELNINMYGSNDDFVAELDFSTLLINSSQDGDEIRQNETILFKDGKYTASTNGQPSAENKNITTEQMQKTCQNFLLGTVLMPKYILNTTSVANENTIRYEYTVTNDFAETLCQNACITLYAKPELLLDLSSANTTNILNAYLDVNKDTGLPISAGILYSGTYLIEEHPYLMNYQTDQTYDLASQSAQNAIA